MSVIDPTPAEPAGFPLVLRPVGGPPSSWTGSDAPPDRWELVDPWATPEVSPAAVVATRRTHEVVRVVSIQIRAVAPAGTARSVVQQLVVALRRTDAAVVSCSIADPVVRAELVAAGFVALPEEGRAVGPNADRLILQLS